MKKEAIERIVMELVKEFESEGIEPDRLDEAVHQSKGEEAAAVNNSKPDGTDFDEAHDDADAEAAAINNGGLEEQIRHLLAGANTDDPERAKAYVRGLVE